MTGDFFSMPVVNVELQGMKLNIKHAIIERQGWLDEWLAQQLDEMLTPERLEADLKRQARDIIDRIVREEIEQFYRYGDGRQRIRDAVIAELGE